MSTKSSSETTATTGTDAASSSSNTDPLASVRAALDNSWVSQLSQETPENLALSRQRVGLSEKDDTNQTKRPVLNGHYVLVRPTGLTDPHLLLTSKEVAQDWLQLTDEQLDSDDFVQYVSGNLHLGPSWATPYALSIMGTRYTHNCPFGDGTGYGDGRAIRYETVMLAS